MEGLGTFPGPARCHPSLPLPGGMLASAWLLAGHWLPSPCQHVSVTLLPAACQGCSLCSRASCLLPDSPLPPSHPTAQGIAGSVLLEPVLHAGGLSWGPELLSVLLSLAGSTLGTGEERLEASGWAVAATAGKVSLGEFGA